jgi:hypothetical protein
MFRIIIILILSSFFTAISAQYYSNKPIGKRSLEIALTTAAWPRQPSDQEISNAFAVYAKAGSNCSVLKNATKYHLGTNPDRPLMDNKVIACMACQGKSGVLEYCANLKYDYASDKFFFENVIIPGQRDRSHPIHEEINRKTKGAQKVAETSFVLRPLDLAPLQKGWRAGGGGGNTTRKTTPNPTPEPGGDDTDWVTVVVGGLASALVIAIVNRLRKKKKVKKQEPDKEEEKEAPEEEEHYIIQFNKKALQVSDNRSDRLEVTVYRVTSAGQELANSAQIILTANDKSVTSSKSKALGKLVTDIGVQGWAKLQTVFLSVTVTTAKKTYTSQIPVQIIQEKWQLDIVKLPEGKKGLRPGAKDGMYIYARASVSGIKDHPEADKYTEQIIFKEGDKWLDLGQPEFEKGWMKIYIEASNPDSVRNSVAMPLETTILVSLTVNDKTLQERVKIALLNPELEVNKDRFNFVSGNKHQTIVFKAFVKGSSEDEKWKFKAEYKADYGAKTKKLSDIAIRTVKGTEVEITLKGPLLFPEKGQKELRETLVINAQVEAQEEPLQRHVTIVVSNQGLFLEKGNDENGELLLTADGKLDKILEFGLYVWDENAKELIVPQNALSELKFINTSAEGISLNVSEVLDPEFRFEGLVYSAPWGRYRLISNQEIPGEGERIAAKYNVQAEHEGKVYDCEMPVVIRTYGIGPDFIEWREAYESCRDLITNHIPYGESITKLTELLEKRKMTLGVEGLNSFRKQVRTIAGLLITAKGERGYKSVEEWNHRVYVVLDWAQWTGNIAFNVLSAYFLKGYAPLANISKNVIIEAIICYRDNGSPDDFFWNQLEQTYMGLFSAAEGRVIDVEKLEKWLGVNKKTAWLIFVSYHFIVNLYRTKSVVEAMKQAAREARDEIIVSWLLKKVEKEGAGKGYKVIPKEATGTVDRVKNAIKKDSAGREYVDKKTVVEIMQDPQKVRTLKNHAPLEVQLAFERTRSGIQKAHDQDLIAWISKNEGIPPQNIKIDDFRTPGAQGFSLNTDRDYRVVVRKGKGPNGKDMWIELSTKKWANQSKEIWAKHSDKPHDVSAEDWARKTQQMPTDKYHIEASPDYSDQAIDFKTGEIVNVEPNILKVKRGEAKLLDPDALGNMYHEKVNASIRDNNIPESYAQCKKGVESLNHVRHGYEKQGLQINKLPENIQKGMEVIKKVPVDDTATPERLEFVQKQLEALNFKDVNDFSTKLSAQFSDLKHAVPKKGIIQRLRGN